jgi:hypothetical protein
MNMKEAPQIAPSTPSSSGVIQADVSVAVAGVCNALDVFMR